MPQAIETNLYTHLSAISSFDLHCIRYHADKLAHRVGLAGFNPVLDEMLDDLAHTAGRILEERGEIEEERGVSVTHKPNGHVVLEVEGDDQDFYTCPECDSDAVWMPANGFLACRECGARWEE